MTATTRKETDLSRVEAHYGSEALGDRIFGGLTRAGVDLAALTVDDLAPVDAFHIRGREATAELAARIELAAHHAVLDVGCGIGGTARYLAAERGCHVTGIDLTASYCELARRLSARLGLGERTAFEQGSALELPYHDESFDVVWTEHAQMNIADKQRFYAEAARVLRPGGVLAFHDIFAGPVAGLTYPVPWAATESISFLATPERARAILGGLGLTERAWIDCTAKSQAWFEAAVARNAASGPPPVGLHLVMGESAPVKFANLLEGFRGDRVRTIQAVFAR